MKMKLFTNLFLTLFIMSMLYSCAPKKKVSHISTGDGFTWKNATIYFLMTDRFYNGDISNDYAHDPSRPPAPLRGFMGGDIKGITKKINDGYFDDLGVNAIWMTPLVEQISGSVDEGTGMSYPFHGYWTRDWTAIDKRFGTEDDLRQMVITAHKHGIRVIFDVVANHTGPVTDIDSKWPDEWVKTGPRCTYTSAETTINCTLVDNLPDIKTESNEEVDLPPFLIEKWKKEGRLEQEIAELDAWFANTKYPRTAVNYILKWIVDLVNDYGIDGYRVDTAKHTEGYVWKNLYTSASKAFVEWKKRNPTLVLDDNDLYMVGEVYNYSASKGRMFDYGDQSVDFFELGFSSLINFDFKYDAKKSYQEIFSKYDNLLQNELKGKSVVNYVSSHDDGSPFDLDRQRAIEAGTKLLLCPGGVQIYYGDESARSLAFADAKGDANLRSFMNWEELQAMHRKNGYTVNDVLIHWQKIGQFRKNHPSIGAGRHTVIKEKPFIFTRTYGDGHGTEDKVLIGLEMPKGQMVIDVSSTFGDGDKVRDAYSGVETIVSNGKVQIDSMFPIVLLEKVKE